MLGQRSDITQGLFYRLSIDADIIQGIRDTTEDIHSRLRKRANHTGQFLDAVFVVMDIRNEILEPCDDIRHEILGHRQ